MKDLHGKRSYSLQGGGFHFCNITLTAYRLLDPYAYDGQTDPISNLPDGYGVKLDESSEGRYLYEGLWKQGKYHGSGRIVDNRTGDICYEGGWKSGKRFV